MRNPDLRTSSERRLLTSRISSLLSRRRPLRRKPLLSAVAAPLVALEARVLLSGVEFSAVAAIGNDDGGAGSSAFAVDVDTAGNRYVTGSFMGTVDFDLNSTRPGDTDILTARGRDDVYVAKYAPDNSLIWVTQMGGDAPDTGSGLTDVGREIKVDSAGNVAVTGEFLEAATFGSSVLVSAGSHDAFAAKLNSSGAVQWAQRWGTAQNESVAGVGMDSSGSVYALSTRFNDTIEVKKFSSAGASAWTKSVRTNSNYGIYGALTVDPAGNVYVADNFRGTVDFDPGAKTKTLSAGSGTSGYVLSLTTQGNFRWVTPMMAQTGSTASVESLALDTSGNLFVGGRYSGLVDVQPTGATVLLPNSVGYGAFITKLSTASGSLVWARAFEGNAFIKGLDVDALGSVYATGTFTDSVDFNPTAAVSLQTSAGESDIFVAKLTSAGSMAWVQTIGGTGADSGTGIAVSSTGSISVVGYFSNSVDFDPDLASTHELTTYVSRKKSFLLQLLQS